jgi:hypothetical protein
MSAFLNNKVNGVLQFHTKNLEELPVTLFDNDTENKHFGTLSIITEKSEPITVPLAIFFNVDCSGSMSDTCSDGRTKMQHIIHTLNNVLKVFSEMQNLECYIALDVFDHDIKTIFDFTQMNPSNIEQYMQMVSKIYPNGSTDIEKSLINAKTKINYYMEKNPTHKIVHIQLTDGDATAGSVEPSTLANMVDENYTNIFIGFGKTHNSYLLNALANNKYGEYLFIDKIENAGLVYGEIVNNLVYSFIEEGFITVEDGEIYDWKNNVWTETLSIPKIAADIKKTYHIRCSDTDLINIKINGRLTTNNIVELLDFVEPMPALFDADTNEDYLNDLTHYMYRQKVQELLYIINEYNTKKSMNNQNNTPGFGFGAISTPTKRKNEYEDQNKENIEKNDKIEIRNNVKSLFNKLKNYRNELGDRDDRNKFIKILMDDLYVSYKTMDSHISHMYSCSRQTSQGRQYSYNVTDINENNNDGGRSFMLKRGMNIPQTPVKRSNHICFPCIDEEDTNVNQTLLDNNEYDAIFREDNIDENYDEFDDFVLSQNTDTTYTSPSIVNMMRSVSER